MFCAIGNGLFRSVLAFKPPDLNLPALSCSPIRLGFSQCMRAKRSVDFRMAPKKSSKSKGAVVEPTVTSRLPEAGPAYIWLLSRT